VAGARVMASDSEPRQFLHLTPNMGPTPLESVLSKNKQELRCRKDSHTLRLTRSLE